MTLFISGNFMFQSGQFTAIQKHGDTVSIYLVSGQTVTLEGEEAAHVWNELSQRAKQLDAPASDGVHL